MKKFDLLEKYSAQIPDNIHKEIDLSFAIVDRIHNILTQQNKTQKDLARSLGKSESEISKWMRGTHNFTIETIAKISAALGENIIEVAKPRQSNHIDMTVAVSITDKYFIHKEESSGTFTLSNSSKYNLSNWTTLEPGKSERFLN